MTFNPFYFSPLHLFGLVQSALVHFSQFWSNSVHFNSIRSIHSTAVQFGPFSQYNQLLSIRSNLIHMVHLGLFNPIWSTSIYLVHFKSLQSNSVYLLKNGKIQVWVKSTINYLSNINCSYMISFGYHNKLLKRMRFE